MPGRSRCKLPDFFQDETELRALWSVPETRAKLLAGLAEQGKPEEIASVFVTFQKYLYQQAA